MPRIDIASVPVRTSTIYPAEFVGRLAGRSKQALGNAAGLDQFGVNLTVLAPGTALDDDLRARIRSTLRERGSPRHVPAVVAEVGELPRTLTGKLAEIAVADTVNGRPVRNSDALANPDSLDAIAALEELRA